MVPEVADCLAKLKSREHFTDDDDLVVCNEVGSYLCSWRLRRRFYHALEKAGLPQIVFHSLRSASAPRHPGVGPEHAAGLHGPSAPLDDRPLPAPQASSGGRGEAGRCLLGTRCGHVRESSNRRGSRKA